MFTEDYRFVLHKCKECGKEMVFIYWYKERDMTPYGEECKCYEKAGLHICNHDLTLRDWLKEQDKIRQQGIQ